MKIDRCVCFERPLFELKDIARETSSTNIEDLQKHVEFGMRCQLCHPYVRRMLRTGETEFGEILTEEDEPG
jgi:BFD-like [2Fe-2S] binding domain